MCVEESTAGHEGKSCTVESPPIGYSHPSSTPHDLTILHAKFDEIVPTFMGLRLAEVAGRRERRLRELLSGPKSEASSEDRVQTTRELSRHLGKNVFSTSPECNLEKGVLPDKRVKRDGFPLLVQVGVNLTLL
jgi:hypothetical protein